MVFAEISSEERADRRAAAIRAAEEARRPRILDAVTRIRGIDASALSLQVEEARTRKLQERLRETELEREILATAEAKQRREYQIEEQKRAAKKQYGEELLSMMKPKTPPTLSEAPNSAPFFQGEDPGRDERIRLQRAQQADWIAQAIFEKNEAKSHANAEGGCYVPRDCFDESKRRREIARQFQEENQRLSREKQLRDLESKRVNDGLGAREVGLLKEGQTKEYYRGAAPEAVKATFDVCKAQQDYKAQERAYHQVEDKQIDKQYESARVNSLLSDHEKLIRRREEAYKVGQENALLAAAAKERQRVAKENSGCAVTGDFFSKFGSSSR